jgi:hypothetical protein
MNHIHPASQPGRDGFAGRFAQDIAPATTVAAGQNRPAPPPTAPRQHTMTAMRLRPRTVQLCIHSPGHWSHPVNS